MLLLKTEKMTMRKTVLSFALMLLIFLTPFSAWAAASAVSPEEVFRIPSTVRLEVGVDGQFRVAFFEPKPYPEIGWEVESPDVATIVPVKDQDGVYLVKALKAGETSMTARVGTLSRSCFVTVGPSSTASSKVSGDREDATGGCNAGIGFLALIPFWRRLRIRRPVSPSR